MFFKKFQQRDDDSVYDADFFLFFFTLFVVFVFCVEEWKNEEFKCKTFIQFCFCCKDDDDSDEDEEEDHRWLSARFVFFVFFFRKKFKFAFLELTSGRKCVCEFDRKLVQSGENFTRFSTKNLGIRSIVLRRSERNTHGRRVRLVTDEI